MKVRYDLKAAMRALGLVDEPGYPPNDPSVSWKNTPQITPVPTREDVLAEREYGTPGPREGDEARRISSPRLLSARTTSKVMDEAAGATPDRDPDRRLSTTEADYLYTAKMLANVSPVAAIGFDEQKVVTTIPEGGARLNIAGMYSSKHDLIWADTTSGVSTPVHESIHRGLQKLRDSGSVEAKELAKYDEETVTRAIMLRHFGEIEKMEGGDINNKQMKHAADMLKNPKFVGLINIIDKQAAHLHAKKLMETDPPPVINFNDAERAASGGR